MTHDNATPTAFFCPTPKVVQALLTLRKYAKHSMVAEPLCEAIEVLDEAGVFRAIDEATGYDIDNPNPCTRHCALMGSGPIRHVADCAAAPDPARDPAEYGDNTGYAHAFSVSTLGVTVSTRTKPAAG